jgi:hypothetical protein
MKHMPHTDPVPETLSSVPGYPNTLQIYMMPASSYWQVRAYIGKTLVRRSTKTDVRSKAIVFAKDFYNELLLKRAQGKPLTEVSDFESTAKALLEEDQRRVDRGERAQSMVDDAQYILKQDVLEFFKDDRIRTINFRRITAYVDHLQNRNVSSQTVRNHFIVLRKILKHAQKLELLDRVPPFPCISTKDHPRAWFTDSQYQKLQEAIRKAIKDKVVVRYVPITDRLYDLTEFMVNSFLRPQDIKLLQNKHIEVGTKHVDTLEEFFEEA